MFQKNSNKTTQKLKDWPTLRNEHFLMKILWARLEFKLEPLNCFIRNGRAGGAGRDRTGFSGRPGHPQGGFHPQGHQGGQHIHLIEDLGQRNKHNLQARGLWTGHIVRSSQQVSTYSNQVFTLLNFHMPKYQLIRAFFHVLKKQIIIFHLASDKMYENIALI